MPKEKLSAALQLFMMNIFSAGAASIEEFEQWRKHNHLEKISRMLGNSAKVSPHSMFFNELFDPKDKTNKETDMLMNEISTKSSEVLQNKLMHLNKTSMSHLSS